MRILHFTLLGLILLGTFGPCARAAETPPLPAGTFFPILPYDAGADALPQLLPVASNHPLDGSHEGITRAIVVIHDVPRDANGALTLIATLAGSASDSTIIMAPQFLLESDITRFAAHLPGAGSDLARWGLSLWEDGGLSEAHAPQKGVSSFTALDLLLVYLGDKTFFPDMKDIVIAGHGAGADFVLRYAAAGRAPDLLDTGGIGIRFVAANPASYLYFTPLRPLARQPGFATPAKGACAGYNAYKYGLDKLGDYARREGASAITLRYPARRVIYLAGANVAGDDHYPDTSCAAMLQGPDRLARAENYKIYIGTIFGDTAAATQTFATVPGAGYDPAALFGSACGMSALFEDGNCGEGLTP